MIWDQWRSFQTTSLSSYLFRFRCQITQSLQPFVVMCKNRNSTKIGKYVADSTTDTEGSLMFAIPRGEY